MTIWKANVMTYCYKALDWQLHRQSNSSAAGNTGAFNPSFSTLKVRAHKGNSTKGLMQEHFPVLDFIFFSCMSISTNTKNISKFDI